MTDISWVVLPTPADVARAAAEAFVNAATAATAEGGRFHVALPGGRTPLPAFALLAEPPLRDRVPWERVELFWADERAVGPDDPQSNYRAARDAWLAHLPTLDLEHVHRMMAETSDLATGADHYEAVLRASVPLNDDGIPVFDLVWLGMGPDGHTASLFPGGDAVNATQRWVVPAWAPALDAWRLSLTLPVLNAGRRVLFVVTGPTRPMPGASATMPAICSLPTSSITPTVSLVTTSCLSMASSGWRWRPPRSICWRRASMCGR